MNDVKFHSFGREVSAGELPERFTYPFCYQAHPLCVEAAERVKQYVGTRTDWADEINKGKMLGVLVVQNVHGEVGFLAAFSGNLCHSNNHEFFVPPVYDLLNPEGEFRMGEMAISAINAEIASLQNSERFAEVKCELKALQQQAQARVEQFRAEMKAMKQQREAIRAAGGVSAEKEAEMIAQSQFMKAEFKRFQKAAKMEVEQSALNDDLAAFESQIDALKSKRKKMSAELQNRLFELFVISNAKGESSDLCDIFADTPQGVPPAGAGECAAPKMLQYAYLNGYAPRAMAEFWWGQSPAAEIRHHGSFYPSCRSKCLPILTFMMQGLEVDPNPHDGSVEQQLRVAYDDQWLTVVEKPAGMTTVPGKLAADSLMTRYAVMFPDAQGPLIVHRLDMATSGLVVVAKDKNVHKSLQSQFADRRVVKTYEALLDGLVTADSGVIDLPMRANPDDRPRQVIDFENGKKAVTHYRVLERKDGITRIEFQPHTGRTHQLRMHSAHSLGLNAPIVGDTLYARSAIGAERLCLHAKSLQFQHPVTGKEVRISTETPF